MSLLRSSGLSLHRCFTWNPSLARAYLRTWCLMLRRVPAGRVRTHIANNLLGADWPQFVLEPVRTEFPDGSQVLFRPRLGSRAFTRAVLHGRVAHEPETYRCLAARLGGYDAVVEIGANVGLFTVFFSKRLPADGRPRVFAFEPSQTAFCELRKHLELNACANVQTFNRAVSTRPGLSSFFENDRDLMKGSLDREIALQYAGGGREIQVSSADGTEIEKLVTGFDRILLKIDVVGSEADVLTALAGLIGEKRPDIILGVSILNLAALNDLDWLIRDYKLFKIELDRESARTRFVDNPYCNYLLTPIGANRP
jgi:FkbM family methyltransferase